MYTLSIIYIYIHDKLNGFRFFAETKVLCIVFKLQVKAHGNKTFPSSFGQNGFSLHNNESVCSSSGGCFFSASAAVVAVN